jgi:hypothetical protein
MSSEVITDYEQDAFPQRRRVAASVNFVAPATGVSARHAKEMVARSGLAALYQRRHMYRS